MVVDDSATNVILLKGILEEEGYQVITAANGRKALQLLDKEQPNLILLDLMMPHMSGFKFLENMLRDNAFSHIPVIIVSAKTDMITINKAMKLGARDYMVKPIEIHPLIDKVDKLLEQHV